MNRFILGQLVSSKKNMSEFEISISWIRYVNDSQLVEKFFNKFIVEYHIDSRKLTTMFSKLSDIIVGSNVRQIW